MAYLKVILNLKKQVQGKGVVKNLYFTHLEIITFQETVLPNPDLCTGVKDVNSTEESGLSSILYSLGYSWFLTTESNTE